MGNDNIKKLFISFRSLIRVVIIAIMIKLISTLLRKGLTNKCPKITYQKYKNKFFKLKNKF